MIITQTPFRVSFLGGGTDLPEFYRRAPGCVLSATISKYMYIAVHPFFFPERIQLKYSRTELVDNAADIQHPILREVLQRFGIAGVDINSIADVPASTGLGSSSAFTVGLLHALYAYTGRYVAKARLAAEACEIEIERLREPIGKQDQYAAAFGGLNLITFHGDGRVDVEPVIIPQGRQQDLERNLMLFYTGITRPAATVLAEQKQNTRDDARTFETLCRMAAMATEMRVRLAQGDVDALGAALHEGWVLKQTLARAISNDTIADAYALARQNGAVGGKLLGAGGGGFLLLYVYPDAQARVRQALRAYRELRCTFDHGGSKIIHVGD